MSAIHFKNIIILQIFMSTTFHLSSVPADNVQCIYSTYTKMTQKSLEKINSMLKMSIERKKLQVANNLMKNVNANFVLFRYRF